MVFELYQGLSECHARAEADSDIQGGGGRVGEASPVSCVWTWPNGRLIHLDICMAFSFYSYSEHICLFMTV